MNHPDLNRITYDGIENCYHLFRAGKHWGGSVDRFSEPFRSKQLQLGVQTTYAIPIALEGEYWGIVGFDFCKTARLLKEAEIEVIRTAATCIGSAIKREAISKKQTEQKILLERQKTRQLEERNQILQQRDREVRQSYRILKATAEAANVLLTEVDFDRAVNKALQIIGQTLDTDRVTVVENWHNPSTPNIPHWRLLYEWHSSGTISQISNPELTQGSYEGIEKWYTLQSQGQSISRKLSEIAEPFRSGQEKLGVKVIHAVPIFIEGKHWGIVGFDDCRRETNRSEAELSILKTAAACIGSAIEKERSRCAKEEAERAILLEREKAALEQALYLLKSNQTLSSRDKWLEATANAANKLLKIADLDVAMNAALKVLGESLNCDRVCIMQHFEARPGFVRPIYEWDSERAVSQMSHPKLNEISAEGIEDWFVTLKAGGWVGGTIDELREPFRSGQIELGVKATYSVPIFVNNVYWGAICIDFCREPKRLTAPEIAVFKTAASCIGSAIYRQQIQQDKEQAELAVLGERNRMAREIHDTLAQAFTGISLQLEAARNILDTQPTTAREHMLRAKNLAKEGIIEARRSVRALRPETLEFNNLAIALGQLVDTMTSGINIKAKTIIEGEIKLTRDREADLYRIAQEAVTNTLRHARATELTVSLTCYDDSYLLQIKDNGIGFKPEQISNDSFGLIGMQERCDRYNGELTINSLPDRGTEITIIIPA